MSITDNVKLVVRICELYYEKEMSQKEISAELGISRPQVCRAIAAAKEQGLVKIIIENPYSEEAVLENALIEEYGLDHAFVVKTTGRTEKDRLSCFAKAVGKFMSDALPLKGRIGISSGRTISSVAQYLGNVEKKNFEFIPLMGGISAQKSSYQSSQLAQYFAQQTGGKSYSLNAPLMVKNEETKKILEAEPAISKVLRLGKRCDVTVLGIESVRMGAANAKAIGLKPAEQEMLKEKNAVVSVCTSFFDEDGKLVETALRSRIIGQSIEDISNSKTILVVIGPEKATLIKAALKSGYIKMIMTDEATAQMLLK